MKKRLEKAELVYGTLTNYDPEIERHNLRNKKP